jgi:hypothetical protein
VRYSWEEFEHYADVISAEQVQCLYQFAESNSPNEQELLVTQPTMPPSNRLEHLLVAAQRGQVSMVEFVCALLDEKVYVPSYSEIQADSTGFRPIVFDNAGDKFVAVFTSLERVASVKDKVPYALENTGRSLFSWFPRGFGVVVNPGYQEGCEIPGSGIESMLRDHG